MKKRKRFEIWRLHLQPERFQEAWRQLELDLPGQCGPGEIEVLPADGEVRVYHVDHHYRRA